MEFLNLAAITAFLPNIIGAIVILIVGWIIAAIVASILRGVLRRTTLDNRLARAVSGGRPGAAPLQVENGIAKAAYYLILLFVIIAALQTLGLAAVAAPLNTFLSLVLLYIPRLIGAGVLIAVAWLVATLLRTIVARVLATARIDERLGDGTRDTTTERAAPSGGPAAGTMAAPNPNAGGATRTTTMAEAPPGQAAARGGAGTPRPLSETLAEVVYWLVWLLFLPAILGALGLEGILAPVQSMLDRALTFLPNLVAAGVILVVGWFVARLVQRIVTGLLASVGVDGLADRVGIGAALGTQRLSNLLGLLVYVLIFIPVLLAALNALQLDAITGPVSNMLNQLLAAIPNIFAAGLVLVIAYVVGRMVAGLVTNVLAGVGFDALPARLGLTGTAAAVPAGGQRPSQIAGTLVLIAIMLFAAVEASRFLGFALLATLLAQFLVFAGQILAGLAVFAIALYLSTLAADLVRSSGVRQSGLLALAARVSVLVLGSAMALRQMGLANEIINLAFGLLLGALALATGLAFGLGGREVAGEELRDWRASLRTGDLARAAERMERPAVSGPTRPTTSVGPGTASPVPPPGAPRPGAPGAPGGATPASF